MTKDAIIDMMHDIMIHSEVDVGEHGECVGMNLNSEGTKLLEEFANEICKKETNLIKESVMKEQQLFNYAVTETIKVKDDNGNVESSKLKVHGSGMALPAFDSENAKLKALSLVKLPEGCDIDEVNVAISNF